MFKIIEAPEVEPVTLDEARDHLRVVPYSTDSDGEGVHPDDAYISALIVAARQYCESFLERALISQTLEFALDSFPTEEIKVVRPNILEVESIKYDSDTEQTVDPEDYGIDDYRADQWIVPVSAWPVSSGAANSVRIRYIAGYGETAEDVPMAIRQALLLLVGHWYAHRESVDASNLAELPMGVNALLRPYQYALGFA